MAYYKDLRDHIRALDSKNKLVHIRRPINKDTELHPLVRWQFRGLPEAQLRGLVSRHIETPQLGFLGQERVNVLKLNLALDELARASRP